MPQILYIKIIIKFWGKGINIKLSRSVVADSLRPRGLQPTRLLHPWDSPGKNQSKLKKKMNKARFFRFLYDTQTCIQVYREFFYSQLDIYLQIPNFRVPKITSTFHLELSSSYSFHQVGWLGQELLLQFRQPHFVLSAEHWFLPLLRQL